MSDIDNIFEQDNCVVPLLDFSAAKAEALLCGRIPFAVPVDVHVSPAGIEQVYSLAGLESYHDALSGHDSVQVLKRLASLCRDTVEHPALMEESLGLLAEDRLFWDGTLARWRYLVLIADSPVWQALPSCTPDEIWSALFVAAMEACPAAEKALQNVVNVMSDAMFSVEGLLRAIEDEVACHAAGDAPAEERPEEPEGEVEYRPWETQTPRNIELATTGSTAVDAAGKNGGEPDNAALGGYPVQPVIPGIAPPDPPTWGNTPLPEEKKIPTVKLYADTCVLGSEVPPEKRGNVTRVEVAKIPVPRVVRVETQEMAYVDRATFVIGSKAGAVDFLIRNNPVISRRHAAIVTKDSLYYIVDVGSKNGVFVGGRRIPQNQEIKIDVGDVFTLANEKFKLQW